MAIAVHAVLLSSMGLVRPRFVAGPPDDESDLQLRLMPRLIPRGSEPVTASARQARRNALAASPLAGLIAPAPASPALAPEAGQASVQADAGGVAKGAGPGCDPEDLPLLTPDEKVRCRNQIEIARTRRARSLDDADLGSRMAAMRGLPKVDGIAPGKRAYYDAVAAAGQAVREDFRAAAAVGHGGRAPGDIHTNVDMSVGVRCAMKFGVNKGRPVASRLTLKLGPFNCPLDPPPGVLTEEARIPPP